MLGVMYCWAACVSVNKCTVGWQSRCGVCGCYIIPCTRSTATFGTVRISYVNHTSGAVMGCRRVSTYTYTRVCIRVGVTTCVYTRTQEH